MDSFQYPTAALNYNTYSPIELTTSSIVVELGDPMTLSCTVSTRNMSHWAYQMHWNNTESTRVVTDTEDYAATFIESAEGAYGQLQVSGKEANTIFNKQLGAGNQFVCEIEFPPLKFFQKPTPAITKPVTLQIVSKSCPF